MESIQHVLDRIRSPRVQITYDVETGGAIQKKELPFVMGILADLSGLREQELPVIKDRKFVEIDRDNFNDIMSSIAPRLAVHVPNRILNDESQLSVVLSFKSMDDFNPLNMTQNVEPLNGFYQSRVRLKDLMAKLDGNDALDVYLAQVLTDDGKRNELKSLIDAGADAPAEGTENFLEDILVKGRVAKGADQRAFGLSLLKEFTTQVELNPDFTHVGVTAFINACIHKFDEIISAQINEILHYADFQKLEASWLGLHYLVMNSETGSMLKLRLLNLSKQELIDDLEKAVEFDQSQLFKKVYEEEYGTFGGHPYSCLLGDFEFGRHPQDMELLQKLAGVAAAAHAPFLAAANPELFGLESFNTLGVPRDLAKIFESTELTKWRSFRETEDSRYVTLTLPHILLRLPYGPNTLPVNGLNFVEKVDGQDNRFYCWGNAAYALAQRITNAFSCYGWTAAIRGVEGGGLVENLPSYTFKTIDGDISLKCPTEVTITDRREKELSDLGFISLCHCKGTDYAAFFGGQTAQKSKKYSTNDANANAELSSRLPYVLAASRFAHYIKVMMREKIGSFMTKGEIEHYLSDWIGGYVLLNDDAPQSAKAAYPLREARISVDEVPGKPGSYKAVIYLRPHFQLEEFSASLRLVANIPAAS